MSSAAPAEESVRLIAGLGNPGPSYAHTRHNLGFRTLDALAARHGLGFQTSRQWKADYALWGGVLLLKPLTYMNLSGESVAAALRYYKWPGGAVAAVVDDLDLPLGKLRLRQKGSAGGHNGLRSLIAQLGNSEFPRLRLGIGEPPGRQDPADFVLGKFTAEEQPLADLLVQRAADALESIRSNGFTAAMNLFNQQN